MSPVSNEPDELLDQVLEDEREAALQEFRDREEFTNDRPDMRPSGSVPRKNHPPATFTP